MAELKALVLQNLKEASELGEELQWKIPNLRQRLLEAANKAPVHLESGTLPPVPRNAAGVQELGSEAA